MSDIIQSAWWIVYYISDEGPRYLLIKRHAMSGKIEWVAPKWKLQKGESSEVAALREISEETGIPINKMKLKEEVGKTHLRSTESGGGMNKDVTYYLVEYSGDPSIVKIIDSEWYLWFYKWANIREVVELLYYQDMRELIRDAHKLITKQDRTSKVKQKFMNKLS